MDPRVLTRPARFDGSGTRWRGWRFGLEADLGFLEHGLQDIATTATEQSDSLTFIPSKTITMEFRGGGSSKKAKGKTRGEGKSKGDKGSGYVLRQGLAAAAVAARRVSVW